MAKKKINYAKRDVLNDAEFDTKAVKERITIWLDEDVLDAFRARAANEGTKYQTLVNAALRAAVSKPSLVERVEKLEKKLGGA
jgi:uncharacterized protein (DUF4415 family)